MLRISILLFIISAAFSARTPADKDYYLAAVVEYSPKDGKDTLLINAKEYATIIKTAAPNADIIVFPEVGIFLFDKYQTFIKVPDVNNTIAPADDEEAHPVLRIISEAARNHRIYVVINVHEQYYSESDKKTYHYNTNAVFNRSGNVIAKYRKFNLFDEPLDTTSKPEPVVFEADFGVRFGIFTCFDILFEKPALSIVREKKITDVVYPTFWYSSLPFLTAVQTQAGWAYVNDINLLASGGNRVSGATTGSGIYAGKKGPVVYLQSQRNETTILFAKVIKKGKPGVSTGEISNPIYEGPQVGLLFWEDPVVSKLETTLITPQTFNSDTFKKVPLSENPNEYLVTNSQTLDQNICHGKICCNFKLNMTVKFRPDDVSENLNSENPYQYRLAAFDGLTLYLKTNAWVQLCSVISCLNNSLESCGKPLNKNSQPMKIQSELYGDLYLHSTVFHSISIKTETFDENVFLFPNILELSSDSNIYGSLINISQFSFESHKTVGKLQLTSEKLITSGMYGRVFWKDVSSSATNLIFTTLVFLMLPILFYILY